MKFNHKKKCPCAVCQMEAKGLTHQEAIAEAKRWEYDMLARVGWFIHLVGDDSDVRTGFNAHTHGLAEKFDHPDFQVVIPLHPGVCQSILNGLADKVKAGAKYSAGDRVPGIIRGYDIKLIEAQECGRPVLRVILPDKDGHLEKDEIVGNFSLQYE